MGYTREALEKMAAKLREIPPAEKSKVDLNKQESVKFLVGEINSLQKNGYTIEQITESLKGVGFDISTPTLKSYLQKVRGKKNKVVTRRKSVEGKPPAAAAPQATARAAKEESPKKTGKDAFLREDKTEY
jgi:ribosomal protein L12E/L44/L45/RPP1/RPP2